MTIKRYSYILTMIKKGQKEAYVRIHKRMEWIVIDEEVTVIVNIINEIIEWEKTEWLRNFYIKLLKGKTDISI